MRLRFPLLLIALLIAPVGAAFLLWPSHGLWATYRLAAGASPVEIVRTVDRELYFPRQETFQTPAMLHWNDAALGTNREFRPLDVTWTGWLRVPHAGAVRFEFEGPGQLDLDLGGQHIALAGKRAERTASLPAGALPLSARYLGTEGFRLFWTRPDGPTYAVSWWDCYRRRPLPFAHALAALALVGLLAFELALLRRYRPALLASLRDFVVRRRVVLALVLLLGLTLGTRLYRYTQVPYVTETMDEYSTALDGLHLVYAGVPCSWSWLAAYRPDQITRLRLFGNNFYVVRPYFDHPPGFHFLVGLYLRLRGVRFSERFEHFFDDRTRPIPIALSVADALLLFFLAARVLGRRRDALLAVLLFAVLPLAVFSGRLVKEEHAILTCFLGSALAAEGYLRTGRARWLGLAAALAGATCLFKVTGVGVVAGVAALLFAQRRVKGALIVAAAGAVGLGLFFAWGAAIDWTTFWAVFRNQGTHASATRNYNPENTLSPEGLAGLVGLGTYAKRPYFVLTYLWLWLSWLLMAWEGLRTEGLRLEENLQPPAPQASSTQAASPIFWPLLGYLAFMAIGISSSRSFYGWYRIPFYPFLAVAGAWWIARMVREGNAVLTLAFCALPVWDGWYWGALAPAYRHAAAFRLALVVPIGLVLATYLAPVPRRAAFVRVLAVAAVVLGLILMVAAIANRYYIDAL